MNWKFWKKNPFMPKVVAFKLGKFNGPKAIPSPVGHYLVANRRQKPEWVWSLRCALRKKPGPKNSIEFRVFDHFEAERKKIPIRDYNSLDQHRTIIFFEGWFDQKSNQVNLKDLRAPADKRKTTT